MELQDLKPKKVLNKAFLKIKPNRTEIECFKENLITLLSKIDEIEREENQKTHLRDFLRDTYYKENHEINTKDTKDLVIHHGKTNKTDVGVIIEAKRPSNKSEMIRKDKINSRAFHELILYYLRERITEKNINVKHLIISNVYEWFIFDEVLFERLFAQNTKFVQKFKDFEASGKRTEVFYTEIAEPFVSEITHKIEFAYFDIREYEIPLRNKDKKDDNQLIALYKLLSPEHLLKLPFANDSNSLDKRFYGELLHIIGLVETKDGSKKLIERNKDGERNTGSFLENAIIQLDSLDKISHLEKPSQFGANLQERLFNVGLELSITWINRILFLKLLEAQLLSYHKGDISYEFLNFKKIKDYDELNNLFFQVLARKLNERNEDVKAAYAKVPYLNSSLFEPTEIEQSTIFISNLSDNKTLPIYSQTVLKDSTGKKRTGSINPLEYLFEFLNAYDFTSEGSEEIQEDNKTLINASVLGLIFEKINGYKDGSFFTPGFITMYMCRETIRKAVIQKFNEIKGWNCTDITSLYNQIDNPQEANEIINDLKICDPAVGSGHFLVSALNEMIAIKSDLKILQDREGKRLKEYHFEVVNDELIVTDEDGELFEYNPTKKESQRIQETLFHEKQTIIENCLFGVDLNPNSVKICRLRLWIELLKNAYYKNETELETLPNIDINIKCGNSLVSRFALDADLKEALKRSPSKWTINSYRIAVDTYRNAKSKDQKREMERLINEIKTNFRSEISLNDPKAKRLKALRGELFTMTRQGELFELSKQGKTEWNAKLAKLHTDAQRLETEIEEIKSNKIYENAFEWRFEFPEVLNDDGYFIGFDVIIGNPPYLSYYSRESVGIEKYEEDYYRTHYEFLIKESLKSRINSVMFFFEKGFKICKPKGVLSFIVDFNVLENPFIALRRYIIENWDILKIHNNLKVFDDVGSGQIMGFFKAQNAFTEFELYDGLSDVKRNIKIQDIDKLTYSWTPSIEANLLNKIESNTEKLENCLELITGVAVNATVEGKAQFIKNSKENDSYYPLLEGGFSIPKPYSIPKYSSYINYDKELEKKMNDEFDANYYRTKGSHQRPFNLRKIEDFNRDKIFIRQSDTRVTATYSADLLFGNYSLFTAYHKSNNIDLLKVYLAILNSKVITFYAIKKEIVLIKVGKTPQLRSGQRGPIGLRQLPFPKLENEHKKNLACLVNQILSAKSDDSSADTSELECQIDQLVYQLYNLTKEEIAIIENGVK